LISAPFQPLAILCGIVNVLGDEKCLLQFFSMTATHHLKVYVFPSLHGKLCFHAKFLKPSNKLELGALFVAYCTRKWRYQLSDFAGQHWHSLSKTAPNSVLHSMYRIGNRLTTRKAEDEYFFKTVPNKAEHIEFIFPSSIPEIQIREQLREWMSQSHKFTPKLVFFSLLLPTNFFVAKVLGLIPANALFTYHIFRLNASFRAMYGSKRLQTLIDTDRVTWTPSTQLESQIQEWSAEIEKELAKAGQSWTYVPRQDLHDLLVDKVAQELRLPELKQSIRRSRMHHFVHPPK
jgi:hypothetical protein